jgi:hypothetical protein
MLLIPDYQFYGINNRVYRLSEKQWLKAGININNADRISNKYDLYKNSKPIQKLSYEWLAKQCGIFSFKKDTQGLTFSIIDYLDKHLKDYKIIYLSSDEKTQITDTTDRSIRQIVEQGYRGNRLDIMVGNYSIEVHTDYDNYHYYTVLSTRRGSDSMIARNLNLYCNCHSVLNALTKAKTVEEICERR